jgi:tetratricopeptide (TPR) repeat protein
MGQENEANRHFTQARDYDALRFRADSRINEIIRQTSRNREKEGIYFVDGQEALARRSPHGLTGAELLYEHVHLNFDGNYWMALEIANRIAGLLPAAIISKAPAGGDWLSSSDCARELAWTDWNRHETAASLLVRLNDPPYTAQLDHEEQLRRLQRQLEALLPAMRPEGLRLAAEFYRRAINRHPDDWSLYVNFSGLQQRLGDNSGAYESWKRVAQLLPHRDAVLCELGLALSRLGRFPEAIEQFEEALRRQPDSLQALNGLGLALSQHGKNQEALLAYRRALKVNPDYFETNLNMGNALKALGKSEEASVQYRTALKHPPNDPGELVVLANICAAQGWNADAIDACERALRLAPFDAMPHLALGGVMAAMGRNSESQQHYSEAVQLKPDLAEAHFKLGLALGRQGLDAQAVARFAEAVRLAPAMIEARLNLGVALLKQKKYQEAAPHFQEALRLNPNNAIARKCLENIAAIQAKP